MATIVGVRMGHPGIPIALLLIALLGVWLGIFGPLPTGAASWIHQWQTLLAAIVASTIASIAAYVAFQKYKPLVSPCREPGNE